MTKKRMFSLSVIDTDAFLSMPMSSRLLYYELGMRADDDGFVDNWKKILMFTGLKEDDMKVLIAKSYIIPFESGVIVIRHWRLNNYLRNDRYTQTNYLKEKEQLEYEENGAYTLKNKDGIPYDNQTDTKISIDKNSIDKYSIEEKEIYKEKESRFKKPSIEEIKAYCEERHNDINPNKFYEYYEVNNWKDKDGKQVKNWKQKIITWEGRSKKDDTLPDWFNKDIKEKSLSKEQQNELDAMFEEFK